MANVRNQLPEYVLSLLDNIAKSEGIPDYEIETAAGSNHGDGMCGIITSVIMTGHRQHEGQPTEHRLHLLCKVAPENAARRKEFNSEKAFTDEVFAYNRILPLFAEFQREKGIPDADCFSAYPKCYAAVADHATGQYAIIMENLRHRNYQLWPKRQAIPKRHAYLVAEQLAKFHAISFALKDQRPAVFDSLRADVCSLMEFFEKCNAAKFMHGSYDRAMEVLKNPEHVQIMQQVKDRMIELLRDCLNVGDRERHCVVGHGDFWINNMLFQYENDQVKSFAVNVCK